jgi:nicotinamide phosphoribosyltransferase
MSTSATIAYYYRQIGNKWYDKTGANKGFLDFAFHDFSYRGMSGSMDAVKSGTGHLVPFKGTDTVPAIPYIEYHYSGKDTFIGASVPATEHSIQTAFVQNDYEYIRSMIQDKVPSGIVSVVADGYDYWAVLTDVLPKLKDVIMNRKPDAMGFAKTVIRPDSGNPVHIIAGYSYREFASIDEVNEYIQREVEYEDAYAYDLYKIDGKYFEPEIHRWEDWSISKVNLTQSKYTEEEVKGSIQVLWELFGGSLNNKGYKVLDPHIGLIYGDSITLDRADEILSRLEAKGFSADNVVFGVGSYTYQYNTRDTLGFAMKATNITKDGVDIPLFKDPKTDDGTKKSAKGLLCVMSKVYTETGNTSYVLYDNASREVEKTGALTTLFKDGEFKKHQTFAEIRERLLNDND